MNFKVTEGNQVIKCLMVLLILAFVQSASGLSAQATFFIDPENVDDPQQDGSIDHPFTSYFDVAQSDGSCYLLKQGTILEIKHTFSITHNNISFGAYGTGDRPHIIYSGDGNVFEANDRKDIRFFSLNIEAPGAISCLNFSGEDCYNIKIVDCRLHGSQWGIRATGNFSTMTVSQCGIFNIQFDGIFAGVENIEIANCHIYNVNQAWFTDPDESFSTGDCIQLVGASNNFYVHHNILDRTGTGNKFCFNISGRKNDSGIFEHNTCLGDASLNSSCIFLGSIGKIDLRYNILSMGQTGIYSLAHSSQFHYNQITGCYEGIVLSNPKPGNNEVYNNVLYDNRVNISTQGLSVKINNNIVHLTNSGDIAFQYPNTGVDHSDYNLIFPEQENFIRVGEIGFNSLSDFQEMTGLDRNSTNADPLFVDAANGDFQTKPTSPCVKAGVELGLKMDFDGNILQAGNAPDIGCFEIDIPISHKSMTKLESQEINISKGWSIISTYIEPTAPNLEDVFKPILDEIIILKDGHGSLFWPALGINQIGDICPAEGFLICARADCRIKVKGLPVDPENTEIFLPANYSYMGYVGKSAAPIENILKSISKQIQLVKDGDGLLYWSEFDINEIGDMEAGRGYQVIMKSETVFRFPANEE